MDDVIHLAIVSVPKQDQYRGSFNNYVDQIVPNCDHPPPLSGGVVNIFDTKVQTKEGRTYVSHDQKNAPFVLRTFEFSRGFGSC